MLLGEAPPTAGLPPRLSDLLGGGRHGAFQERIAEFIGAPSVVLTSTGTAALVLALDYLKQRSGRRRVIVPAYTCPLVVLAAAHVGLEVAVCDTIPSGLDLDLDHLGRLIGSETLAVIATQYGGALTDVAGLRAFVRTLSPDIAIIEDAAQGFGARSLGASVGLAGDIGMFSFGAGKGFTIFQGGCLASSSAGTMDGLLRLSKQRAAPVSLPELWLSAQLIGYHVLYNPIGLRLVYGMPRRHWLRKGDEIAAVGDLFPDDIELHEVGRWRQNVGRRALPRLPAHLRATRARFIQLADRFSAVPGVTVLTPGPEAEPTCLFLFVTLPTAERCRQALARLWRSRLGVTKLFAHAIGDYAYLSDKLIPGETPNARDFAARTLTVTTSPWLGEREIESIVAGLR